MEDDKSLDDLATKIIAHVAATLPDDSHLKVVEQDGQFWFFFRVHSVRAGVIRGCLNPHEGVKALLHRYFANPAPDITTIHTIQFTLSHATLFVRELLADLNQNVADFIPAILNKAELVTIEKDYKRASRVLRQHGRPELAEDYSTLADSKQAFQELGDWLFEQQFQREKLTAGRKESRLRRWEVIEAKREYDKSLKRFEAIKEHFEQVKGEHKPPRRNQSFVETLKTKWEEICLATVQYQDIPPDIIALFTEDHTARPVALAFIARKYGISSSSLQKRLFPSISKSRKPAKPPKATVSNKKRSGKN